MQRQQQTTGWRHPKDVAAQSQPYRINKTTTALRAADGVSVQHRNPDGSETVARWRPGVDHQHGFEAYRVTTDRRTGTQTRLDIDGHQTVTGRDFIRESAPGRITTTAYSTGLHSAALPNGKVVFNEQFQSTRDRAGNPQRAIVRTVYMRVHNGRAISLRAPVVETYVPVPLGGEVTYAYSPPPEPDGYYDPFFVKFSGPIALAAICASCSSNDVEINRGFFASGKDQDDDPAALMADAQIATGFEDGYSGDADDVGPDDAPTDQTSAPTDLNAQPDAETVALQNQVDQLQTEVTSAQAQNVELKEQLTAQQRQTAALEQRVASLPSTGLTRSKIQVPSDLRDQVRKQVKAELTRQKAQQPLSLADVIASAKAEKQLFQANKALKVERTGLAACTLTTGDWLKFERVPAPSDKTVVMRLVLGKPGSCANNDIVNVNRSDVQDMLNGFAKRLQDNVKRAHDSILAAEQKPSQKSTSG